MMPRKNQRGRPAGVAQDRILHMRVSAEWLALVDAWRGRQPVIPSRSDAVRALVEMAVRAGRPSRPKK